MSELETRRPSRIARLGHSLFGAAAAGFIAAVIEAAWARDDATPFAALWWFDAGALAPVSLSVGLLTGLFALFLHERPMPPIWRVFSSERDPETRRWAVMIALGSVVAVVVVAALANGAFRLLASEASPAVVGAAIASLAGAAMVTSAIVLPALAARAASALGTRAPSARVIVVGGVTCALLLAGYGIASGTTSGDGGILSILGVLKRQELDKRPVLLLAWLVLAAYVAPIAVRIPAKVAALGPLLAFAALASTAYGLRPGPVATALDRDAPLTKYAFKTLRRITDDDRDGFSDRFGGGDCNDAAQGISPKADDIPENGIDEDCSGKDDVAVALETEPEAVPLTAAQWMQERLPPDIGVVLITVDTLRYDLGYTGYERPISPNLDELAKRSVVFENAYALASYTGKSLGPMLIGKYTSETHRGWLHFNRFGKEDTFVQERLQRAGVRTMSVQGHFYFTEEYGLGRGFHVEDHTATPRVHQIEGDTTVNSDELTDAAIKMLSSPENVRGEFYLWVHYLDPHAAYVRHEEFDFGNKGRDLYDGEVAFVDHHIGRLLDAIARGPLANRTAIIVTSDHGEAFGEHGMYRHGFELWEELIRVPLIVYVPGVPARRIEARRSAVDIAPTILELFGIEPPEGETGEDFMSGRSLLPDVMMPPGHDVTPRIVFVDMSAGPYNTERQAFIEDGKKLVAAEGQPVSLFDLDEDPGERENLLPKEAISESIVQRYKAFRRSLRTVVVRPTP